MSTRRDVRGEPLLDALETGEIRVAERDERGTWNVNAWVKEGILELFRSSPTVEIGADRGLWPFVDRRALGVRRFGAGDGIRLVPGGSSVRRGAHVGHGVVIMPPSYVNVGAFIGPGTMVDSHVLVGSCAQVGAGVHLSAGVQLGGVLEPPGARPVVVEDGAWIGAQSGIFEGCLVRAGAVIGAGVTLTASTRVFDLAYERELSSGRASPPEIPPGAVVVPGSRPARGAWARERGLELACALIVKYRDASTDRATALEEALR